MILDRMNLTTFFENSINEELDFTKISIRIFGASPATLNILSWSRDGLSLSRPPSLSRTGFLAEKDMQFWVMSALRKKIARGSTGRSIILEIE